MEFRHPRSFVALAEALHFGRAAATLGVSQPALSKQIRELEEEIGTPLFWRTKREVRLTPAGASFLGHAREILARLDRSVAEARSVGRGDLGSLEIGYLSTLSARLVPEVVRAFRKRHPRVEVKLRLLIPPAHTLPILTSQVDFAFVLSTPATGDVAVEDVRRERLVLALPSGHPLAAPRAKVPVRALDGVPYVFYPRYAAPEQYDRTMAYLRAHGARPRVVMEVLPVYGILSAIAAGIGVALVPESLQGLRQEGVVYRPLAGPGLPITWAIAYRRGGLSGAQAAFLKVVRALRR